MAFLWHQVFFRPLLNLLIELYNTVGHQNLGLAIIWLTILVRIVLLPASVKDVGGKQKQKAFRREMADLAKHYANNPIALKEEQRALMKRYRFRRWPKVISLFVQGFVLVILYQVFLGGIQISSIVDELYSFVQVPVAMHTLFFGIDVAHQSFILSFVAAFVLFVTIVADHGGIRSKWSGADLAFAFGLPTFTFLALWILPAVKAIFILTSILFTVFLRTIFGVSAGMKEQERRAQKEAEEEEQKKSHLPHPRERFN